MLACVVSPGYTGAMKMKKNEVIDRLEKTGLVFRTLELDGGSSLIVTERGGRLLGPFFPEDGEGFFWLSDAFESPDRLSALVAEGEWNIGGERVWIAPEIRFHVKDRSDFWGTLAVPAAVDPGQYVLLEADETLVLRQDIMLEAYNPSERPKALSVERRIRSIPDPLTSIGGPPAGVSYTGYEHEVSLLQLEPGGAPAESWVLAQLEAPGEIFIPTTGSAETTNYYEPIDGEHQLLSESHVRLRVTGQRRYKVGYRAPHLTGRLSYLCERGDTTILFVRSFFNDPSSPYVEEPAELPGHRGNSVHVYNDGGMFGGFGELECNGRAIGGETGRSSSTDVFQGWIYRGPPEAVLQVAGVLLGQQP